MTVVEIDELISRLDRLSPRSVVAVSGYGGSGKSTLSRQLENRVDRVVRLRGDDFLDPYRCHVRSGDWDGVGRDRMRTEVIEPFRRGEVVTFHPWDWHLGRLADEPTALEPGEVLLIDSIGIIHPVLAPLFDLSIWVDVPLNVAARRGLDRDREDGHGHDELWAEVWVPNDADFDTNFAPREQCDLRYVPDDVRR